MKALAAALLVLAAAGCSSPTTRFYALAPLTSGRPPAAAELVLGVGPVELPKTLDRPQIVTRRGPNEFELGEFDRWTEPLADNLAAVLAENLADLVPARRVVLYPWNPDTDIDYQVLVRVVRFDRSRGGDAVLTARWSLKSPTNANELLARETTYARRPAGEDYAATVAAMNAALADFSRDLAAAVRGLRPTAP